MATHLFYLSGQFLLGNLSPPARQDGQALQQHSSVLLWKSLEVRADLVDPGHQKALHVLEDLAKKSLVHPVLPFDLSLQGSLAVQADHHHQHLGVLVFLQALLDLEKTGWQLSTSESSNNHILVI